MCLTNNALLSWGSSLGEKWVVCISAVIRPGVVAVVTGRDSQRVNKSQNQGWRGEGVSQLSN